MNTLNIIFKHGESGMQTGAITQLIPRGDKGLLHVLQICTEAYIIEKAAELGITFDLDHTTQEASCPAKTS